MKPSSSNWHKTVQMEHHPCGGKWDVHSTEWPPRITVCTGCHAVFKLIRVDEETKEAAFRRIK